MDLNLKRRTNAITAFGKTSSWQKTLEEVRQSGDIAFLNAVVSAVGRASQWQQALRVMHHVQVTLQRDVVSFNSAATAAVRAQWRCALQISLCRVQRGICSDTVSPNLVMNSYGQVKKWREALTALASTVRSVATFVNTCKEAEEWKASMSVLDTAMSAGMKVNVILINTLITCFGGVSRWRLAGNAARFTVAQLWGGLRRDIIMQNACLTALEVAGHWEASQVILHNTRSYGLTPNLTSQNAALKALVYKRHWRLACLACEWRQGHLNPDLVTYSATAHVCGHSMIWPGSLAVLSLALQDRVLIDSIIMRTAATRRHCPQQPSECL